MGLSHGRIFGIKEFIPFQTNYKFKMWHLSYIDLLPDIPAHKKTQDSE